jgi:tellurite resistance protein TerC
VLTFVGIKMLISGWYKMPTALSLAVIATLLGVAIVASLVRSRRQRRHDDTATGAAASGTAD